MTALLEREKIADGDDVLAEGDLEPQIVHRPAMTSDGRPDPTWVRGRCPECGEELVSNMYYLGGKGYLIVWECWGALSENSECEYRRVL